MIRKTWKGREVIVEYRIGHDFGEANDFVDTLRRGFRGREIGAGCWLSGRWPIRDWQVRFPTHEQARAFAEVIALYPHFQLSEGE